MWLSSLQLHYDVFIAKRGTHQSWVVYFLSFPSCSSSGSWSFRSGAAATDWRANLLPSTSHRPDRAVRSMAWTGIVCGIFGVRWCVPRARRGTLAGGSVQVQAAAASAVSHARPPRSYDGLRAAQYVSRGIAESLRVGYFVVVFIFLLFLIFFFLLFLIMLPYLYICYYKFVCCLIVCLVYEFGWFTYECICIYLLFI